MWSCSSALHRPQSLELQQELQLLSVRCCEIECVGSQYCGERQGLICVSSGSALGFGLASLVLSCFSERSCLSRFLALGVLPVVMGLVTLQVALSATADSVRLRPGQPLTPGHYGLAALVGAMVLSVSALVVFGSCVGGYYAHEKLRANFVPEFPAVDVCVQTDPCHENKPKSD